MLDDSSNCYNLYSADMVVWSLLGKSNDNTKIRRTFRGRLHLRNVQLVFATVGVLLACGGVFLCITNMIANNVLHGLRFLEDGLVSGTIMIVIGYIAVSQASLQKKAKWLKQFYFKKAGTLEKFFMFIQTLATFAFAIFGFVRVVLLFFKFQSDISLKGTTAVGMVLLGLRTLMMYLVEQQQRSRLYKEYRSRTYNSLRQEVRLVARSKKRNAKNRNRAIMKSQSVVTMLVAQLNKLDGHSDRLYNNENVIPFGKLVNNSKGESVSIRMLV